MYYDNYGLVLVLDEDYNQVDFIDYDLGEYNYYNFRLPSYSKPNIFYGDETYNYILPFKVNRSTMRMDYMSDDELDTIMNKAIGTDLETINDSPVLFANQTISNSVLGTDAFCSVPYVLGAWAIDSMIKGGDISKVAPSYCYVFYNIKDGVKNRLVKSNTEIIYDAIEYNNKIVALLYNIDEEEHYLVVLDSNGQELSRENLESYNISVSYAPYLMNTTNGFVLINSLNGSCGYELFKRSFSYGSGCYRSNIYYFSSSYKVATKSDGHGKVDVEKVLAAYGDAVKFTVTPEHGYVLSYVKVIDSNGNVLTFTNNTFVMPASDVVVEAVFVPKNPDTATGIIAGSVLVLLGISAFVFAKYYKKVKWLR